MLYTRHRGTILRFDRIKRTLEWLQPLPNSKALLRIYKVTPLTRVTENRESPKLRSNHCTLRSPYKAPVTQSTSFQSKSERKNTIKVLPRYKNKKETPMNPRIERSNKPCKPTQKVLHLFKHLNKA